MSMQRWHLGPVLVGTMVLGWLLVGLAAIPVWILWSALGLGQRYFAFLPAAWQHPPFLDVVGLFLLVATVHGALRVRISATLLGGD